MIDQYLMNIWHILEAYIILREFTLYQDPAWSMEQQHTAKVVARSLYSLITWHHAATLLSRPATKCYQICVPVYLVDLASRHRDLGFCCFSAPCVCIWQGWPVDPCSILAFWCFLIVRERVRQHVMYLVSAAAFLNHWEPAVVRADGHATSMMMPPLSFSLTKLGKCVGLVELRKRWPFFHLAPCGSSEWQNYDAFCLATFSAPKRQHVFHSTTTYYSRKDLDQDQEYKSQKWHLDINHTLTWASTKFPDDVVCRVRIIPLEISPVLPSLGHTARGHSCSPKVARYQTKV